MAFRLPGFESWSFQFVMQGQSMVLEALRDDICLSTILEPLDSLALQAHQLISSPACVLHAQPPCRSASDPRLL
jgi:hypothetical protein